QHTRFSRDWSSDVCSSDLALGALGTISSVDLRHHHPDLLEQTAGCRDAEQLNRANLVALDREIGRALALAAGRGAIAVNVMKAESGRASCRGSVESAGGGA